MRHLPATLALVFAGCSPAIDWRAVPLPDTALVAQMPCRPSRFQRDVVVAGVPLKLFMLSCEAGDVTYGVASAELADPARVESVLAALAADAKAGVRAQGARFVAFDPPGATPFQGNVSARLRGVRPDGATVEESVRIFARGSRVFRVNAIGPTLADDRIRPFEDDLRFDLESVASSPR